MARELFPSREVSTEALARHAGIFGRVHGSARLSDDGIKPVEEADGFLALVRKIQGQRDTGAGE